MADDNFIPLLLQLIAEEKVHTAICVEITPQTEWDRGWHYCTLKQVLNLPFEQRYDLAIVNLVNAVNLEAVNLSHIEHAIVRLRDLFAKKMMVIADQNLSKPLRALGFSQLLDVVPEHNPVQIWQFNILTYKHVPDWFNSKFWANPDNWNKYRW